MRRLLWIVNHKTLLQAEVPILRSLGWEVFVPKILPEHDPGFRSAATSHEFDAALRLPPATLAVLNRHDFIQQGWSPTVAEIVNRNFNVVVTHFSYYVNFAFRGCAKISRHGHRPRVRPRTSPSLLGICYNGGTTRIAR